ncbi:hypothetical protein FH972_014605 [Carpinus fangiana]|uniref:Uncharacterized protein n=1 Tax=Carpinus fangiana TaxID=176857 RepID=A0A5N6RB94_9ROSI|nr:hypothetical protein FH972_014605 [Carpinus fangiana]
MKPSPTTPPLQSLKTNSGAYDSGEVQEPSQFLTDFITREFNAFLWISLIAITALLLRKVLSLFIFCSRSLLKSRCQSDLTHTARSDHAPPAPSHRHGPTDSHTLTSHPVFQPCDSRDSRHSRTGTAVSSDGPDSPSRSHTLTSQSHPVFHGHKTHDARHNPHSSPALRLPLTSASGYLPQENFWNLGPNVYA